MHSMKHGTLGSLGRVICRRGVTPAIVVAVTVAAAAAAGATGAEAPERAQESAAVIAFEGARVIAGDGSDPIENATFVIEGDRFVAVGRSGEVDVPAGAERVDLEGRTVIPALIDTHTHLSRTRPELVEDLQRKAYYGAGAAMSLGQDTGDDVYQVRGETIPNAARYRTAGRGITRPEPGRSDIPRSRHRQDLGRRPQRALREADARALRRGHRRGAPARPARHRAHLHARGCQGAAAGRGRRVRARGSRPGGGR